MLHLLRTTSLQSHLIVVTLLRYVAFLFQHDSMAMFHLLTKRKLERALQLIILDRQADRQMDRWTDRLIDRLMMHLHVAMRVNRHSSDLAVVSLHQTVASN